MPPPLGSTHADDAEAHALSRRALLAALHPEGSRFTALLESYGERIDWPWMLRRAAAHKVAALLAARLEACGFASQLSEDLRAQVHAIRHDARQQTLAAQRTLAELATQFAAAGISFLVIKGSVLAEEVYRDPTLRRFHDVDIVVPPDALARAERLLRSSGYRISQVEKLLATQPRGPAEAQAAEALTQRFYERFDYELPLAPPRGDPHLPIDVHWHIAAPSRLRASVAQLWAQTVPVVVAGTPLTTLTPAATLIHLAVHATTSTFAAFRLLHLCDVAWAAARSDNQIDGLWELAGAWGVREHLDMVLETVERVFDVAMPREGSTRSSRGWRPAVSAAFLVGDEPAVERAFHRVGREVVWGLGMRCLLSNLVRSGRVRLARLRWRVRRWRLKALSRRREATT